jgi:hypothetical protein
VTPTVKKIRSLLLRILTEAEVAGDVKTVLDIGKMLLPLEAAIEEEEKQAAAVAAAATAQADDFENHTPVELIYELVQELKIAVMLRDGTPDDLTPPDDPRVPAHLPCELRRGNRPLTDRVIEEVRLVLTREPAVSPPIEINLPVAPAEGMVLDDGLEIPEDDEDERSSHSEDSARETQVLEPTLGLLTLPQRNA